MHKRKIHFSYENGRLKLHFSDITPQKYQTKHRKKNQRQSNIYYYAFEHILLFVALESLSEDDVEEGGGENLDVCPQTLVFEVVEVVVEASQHLLHSVGIAVVQGGV